MEKKQPDAIGALFSERTGVEGEMSLSETSPDLFDEFQSAGEVAAYVFHKLGEAGLRDLLTNDGTSREWTEDVVAELSAAGLGGASAIAAEVASSKPSMVDVEAFCPYARPPYLGAVGNEINIKVVKG